MTDEGWRFFDHKDHKIPLKIITEIKNRISQTQSQSDKIQEMKKPDNIEEVKETIYQQPILKNAYKYDQIYGIIISLDDYSGWRESQSKVW